MLNLYDKPEEGNVEKTMKKITIVVPCFNEEENIEDFHIAIKKVFEETLHFQYKYDFVFVDDGSKDNTLGEVHRLAEQYENVKYISFSRNFGKEAALYAGLSHATGDYVTVMDADLQDPPELLPEMIEYIESGEYECVATRRKNRKGESKIRSFFAKNFYKIIQKMSNVEIRDGARDYRLMTRKFVNSLLELTEYNRFSKGLFAWVGYPVKWIAFDNKERKKGITKWSFWKLLVYAVDGIVSFSIFPAVVAGIFGMLFCIVAFLVMIFIFARALIFGDPVAGWPSTVCIILFIGGIQLFCTGIIGEYVAKTYMEVKKRPMYICNETNININEGENA